MKNKTPEILTGAAKVCRGLKALLVGLGGLLIKVFSILIFVMGYALAIIGGLLIVLGCLSVLGITAVVGYSSFSILSDGSVGLATGTILAVIGSKLPSEYFRYRERGKNR